MNFGFNEIQWQRMQRELVRSSLMALILLSVVQLVLILASKTIPHGFLLTLGRLFFNTVRLMGVFFLIQLIFITLCKRPFQFAIAPNPGDRRNFLTTFLLLFAAAILSARLYLK